MKILDPLRDLKHQWERQYDEYRFIRSADALFFSFPKCGRTWVRSLMGKALQLQFQLPEDMDILEVENMPALSKSIPKILFLHDDEPFWKKPAELEASKRKYRHKKTMLLVRHPADVLVSAYFEKTKRYVVHGAKNPHFEGSLKEFIYSPTGSTETLIHYYNIWARESRHFKHFLLLRYLDLHEDTERELLRIFTFLGLEKTIGRAAIEEAVAYSTFHQMQEKEKADAYHSFRLRPGDVNDLESYKTRRGKVGGYLDYLEPAEIDFLAKKVNGELDKLYGFSM
ncbi:MAG: sulfotransferase domain-containing protein [Lewinellaceae bacterium]|nr:sulfotransferase domain-containing protein [Saprospiraceae bacterium]MCB9341298.1 sulfotransferase domain-containing protein [Lewinellaceae bacterium]